MSLLNYYEILNSKNVDDIQIIKKNYQKLVLLHHPDKKFGSKNNCFNSGAEKGAVQNGEENKFFLINKAWNVLRDPVKRKYYDAKMYQNNINIYSNVFAELDMEDFERNLCEDESSNFWYYQCRCGGNYVMDDLEIFNRHLTVIVECNECSLTVTGLKEEMTSLKLKESLLRQTKFKYSLYLAFSSLFGILLSSYAVYVEYKIHDEGVNYKAMCDISERVSCSKVFSSSYGKGFGIIGKFVGENSLFNLPNGYIGIGCYGFLFLTSFIYNKILVQLQFILSVMSVIISIYLAYLLYYVLNDLCIVCVLTYFVNFVNFILVWRKLYISRVSEIQTSQNYVKKTK